MAPCLKISSPHDFEAHSFREASYSPCRFRSQSANADGNTLLYDVVGAAGAIAPRAFIYDLENRPIAITQDGVTSRFEYGADTARVAKRFGASVTSRSLRRTARAKHFSENQNTL